MVESHDEVIENENCFIFDLRTARKILEGTNQLKYSLAMTNTKNEAKDEDEESGVDDRNSFISPKMSVLTGNY